MITKYKLFILSVFLGGCSAIGWSQTQSQPNHTLQSSQSGAPKTYIARDFVSLKSGFSYKAEQGQSFNAKIDAGLLFPPTDGTYKYSNGSTSANSSCTFRSLNPPEAWVEDGVALGNIPGQFAVSQTGGATYNIPIECPEGINGMQPKIDLVYNSQGGNGIAGWGWNISGMSMISRTTKTYYYDNEKTGIIWDNTSPYALDGQRLIEKQRWISPTITSKIDSIEYDTENQSGNRIVACDIKAWGPSFFKIYTKSGQLINYGNPNNVASYYPLKGDMTTDSFYNLSWSITSVRDNNGNSINYTYRTTISSSSPNVYRQTAIDKITYGGNSIAGTTTNQSIQFTYTSTRSDYTDTYIDGIENYNNLLLESVKVISNSTEVRKYTPTYNYYDKINHLKSMSLSNDKNEHLKPLNFSWSTNSYQYSFQGNVSYDPLLSPKITGYRGDGYDNNFYYLGSAWGDIDADGDQDIVVKCKLEKRYFANGWDQFWGVESFDYKYVWVLYRNDNGSYTFVADGDFDISSSPYFSFVHDDNDGKDDLLIAYSQQVADIFDGRYHGYSYKYNNGILSSKFYAPIAFAFSNFKNYKSSLTVLPADFLGKGTPQYMLLNTYNNITSPFDFSEGGCTVENIVETHDRSDIYISDFNGNGKSELVYVHDDLKIYEFVNRDYRGQDLKLIYTYSGINHFDDIYTGDFNGDGNTDFLVHDYPNYTWKFLMSTGNSLVEVAMNNTLSTYSRVKIMDVNHDGKSDILFYDDTNNGRYFKLLVSDGTNFEQKFSQLYTGSTYGGFYMDGRINGDKYNDISLTAMNSSDLIGISNDVQFNKITSFSDSYQNTTFVNYDVFNSTDVKVFKNGMDGDSNDDSNRNVSASNYGSWDVVSSVVSSAADNSTTNTTSYDFSSAVIHKQGKGLLGYLSTTVKDLTASIEKTNTNLLNNSYYFLYPSSETTKLIGATTNISENTLDYYPVQATGKLYTHYLKTQNSNNILGGLSSKVEYLTYDAYGNPKSIRTTKGDNVETKTISYVRKGAWCDNKISSETSVNVLNGVSDTRTSTYDYDAKGNLTKQTVDPTDENAVMTEYKDFDDFGHPLTVEVTANSKKRTSSVTYKPSGRFIASKTNLLNETTTYDWDETHGLLNSETDYRSNKTSYKYDDWGKSTEIQYPTGIRKAQVLQWATTGSPTGAIYYSYSQISGSAPTTTWYDVLGREIVTQTYGLDNKKKISVFTEYYPDGKKYRVSDPTFNTTAESWAATYYYTDPYKRLSSVVTPMGTTTTTYSGRTTSVTTPDGTQETTLNTSGQKLTSTVNGKTVTYAYYPSGLIKTSTPQGGQAITMAYDLQGKRINLIDPDGGTVESKYNGFGDLLWERQKVHNNTDYITTTNTYDDAGLGLLQNINRNGEITTYTYDPNYKSRVNSIEITGKNKQSFTFDAFDRVTNIEETVGTRAYKTSKSYDVLGRVKKETYPSGYYTVNTYDSNGNLTEVTDNANRSIWKAIDENAKGQLLHASKGGKTITYDFDSRGLPTGITADGVVKAAYSFNTKGNLEYRTDELYANNIQKEVFIGDGHDYDSQNRLTYWGVYKNGVLVKPTTITYDPNSSNITAKTDLGAFTMSYGGKRPDGTDIGPHALATISGVPPSFPQVEQPNYPTAELSVTYTDFKKIATLTEKNKYYELTYGVDDQRRMSVYKENNITKETRYYLGNYEEKIDNTTGITQKIHYLSGAILIQEDNKPDKFYYTYDDYQGSLIALTDESGTLVERYAYDPWGVRRNPDDWSQNDSRTTWIVNRGYTGHEHLDAFGIINMNGRVYDPYTAMFFSPDPYVQAPDNWLNYNRYGYCYGNPLRYSDPTGLLTWNDIIAGISFIGGVVLECIPGMQWLGTPLIVAGFSHFALTIDQVQNSKGQTSWDQASNEAGFQFSSSFGFNNAKEKEKRYSKNNDVYDVFNYSNNSNQFSVFGDTETYDPAKVSKYQQNANNYNASLNAEGQESALEGYYFDQYGVKQGDYIVKGAYNISDITTKVGVGYGLTDGGRYVNFHDHSISLGYTIPTSNGSQEIHISPYVTNHYSDITFFRSVAGHELAHAYIYSIAPNTPRYISERVAYQYTFNEFMSHGQFKNAINVYNLSSSMNYWGSYPANLNLPNTFYK